MRECTEGMYPDRNMVQGPGEFMPVEGVALSLRKITAHACARIARASFEIARKRRRKVTAVHKANNFIMTDGLFLKEVRKVAEDYPDVTLDDMIVDATAAWLVRDPSRFDVICSTNFYCDILSDLASELSGSLGLAGSINAGEKLVAAQAQHGSAPDIAGKDIANPTSLILSVSMLLAWLSEKRGLPHFAQAANAIDRAIDEGVADPGRRTRDLAENLAPPSLQVHCKCPRTLRSPIVRNRCHRWRNSQRPGIATFMFLDLATNILSFSPTLHSLDRLR